MYVIAFPDLWIVSCNGHEDAVHRCPLRFVQDGHHLADPADEHPVGDF